MALQFPLWLLALLLTVGLQLLGFVISYALKTEKFFDFAGSGNFLLLAFGTLALSEDPLDPRRLVASLLFAASRLWLLIFLSLRAKDRGDSRFEEVKESCIFAAYWIGQAGWVFLIALPIIAVNLGESTPMGPVGVCFAVLFFIALVTQIHSDQVKKMWVEAGRDGVFCRRGCWSWSRHPNYFGEVTMAIAAVGLAGPLIVGQGPSGKPDAVAIVSILSPVYTFLLLMFVSGIPTGEGASLKRYYEKAAASYQEYRDRTPVLIPWCFPGFNQVPRTLKCLCCCEFQRYELPEAVRAELAAV